MILSEIATGAMHFRQFDDVVDGFLNLKGMVCRASLLRLLFA
jgi:hypothetical protein